MRQTLDLYNKITNLTIEGKPVHSLFMVDGYNYWQFFSQRIFDELRRSHGEQTAANLWRKLSRRVFFVLLNIALFLMSVVSVIYMYVFRTAIVVYGIDTDSKSSVYDPRMSYLYSFFTKSAIRHADVLHTLPSVSTIRRFWRRRKPVLYLESVSWVAHLMRPARKRAAVQELLKKIDFSTFSVEEQLLVKKILQKYVLEITVSRFKVRLFTSVLKHCRVKYLFAIDDARYYYELLLACRYAGVRTYAIQHGHFTKYHIGWVRNDHVSGKMIFPDVYFVWSKYWKKELIRLGYRGLEESILIAGTQETEANNVRVRKKHAGINILIPYETVCPKHEVAQYIKAFLKIEKVQVFFKVRPDIAFSDQLAEYGLVAQPGKLNVVEQTIDCIEEVDIVAGVYSTFLYDMIAYEKPVAILQTSSDYGEGMSRNGLAECITFDGSLAEQIGRIANIPISLLIERRRSLYGEHPVHIVDTIKDLLQKEGVLENN